MVDDDLEPIVDDATEWEQFSTGLASPREGTPRSSAFDVVAAMLAAAAVLLVAAAVAEVFGYHGASVRNRAFFVSLDGASVFTSAVALAAVGIELAIGEASRRALARFALATGFLVSCVVVAGAIYRLG